jgi:hypothetical protein
MSAPPLPPKPPTGARTKRRESVSGTDTPGTSDTPPRREAPGPGARGQGPASSEQKSAPTRRGPQPKLQKSLEELFAAPALVYSLAGDEWAAQFVSGHAPALAEAWYKLAQENVAVRRILERITTGTAWGGVIVSTGMVVLPLAAHHGILPSPAAAFFQSEDDPHRGPIVPPPPRQSTSPSGQPGNGRGRGGPPTPADMTPPIREGQPPGVVTVAGTSNNATG